MEQQEIDREAFVASFRKVMENIDAAIKRHPKQQTNANKELKRMGAWDASWIATQYCLVAGGISTLSSRLRMYIGAIGSQARKYYEQNLTNDGKGSNNSSQS